MASSQIIFRAIFAAIILLITSCASNRGATLSDLNYDVSKIKEAEIKKLSHEQVRAEYRELVNLFDDQQLKEQIQRRISGLYMIEGDQNNRKASQSPTKSYYVDAIKSYKTILKKYPNSPNNAEVFYQLAKAYDLEGDQDQALLMLTDLVNQHPDYKYISEAHFRKADIHYNRGEYQLALNAYRKALIQGSDNINTHAHYMIGWVHLKQGSNKDSINAFALVVDKLIDPTQDHKATSEAHQTIVDDCISSISLALNKMGGAQEINGLTSIDNKGYTWLIYDHLGNFYLEKELFAKSADAYRLYIQRFPKSKQTAQLHKKLIQSLHLGKFPILALDEKASYVKSYGKGSLYLETYPDKKDEVFANLRVYLEQLGRYHYTEGQKVVKHINRSMATNKKLDPKQTESLTQKKKAYYLKAAEYYGLYIDTFPNDKRFYDALYLQAESFFQAGKFLIAARLYERVAYDKGTTKNQSETADSAYASIISYQKYVEKFDDKKGNQSKKLSEHQSITVDAMIRFAGVFDQDSRSAAVLTNAANYMLRLGDYERVINVIDTLLAGNKHITKPLQRTAYSIKANAHFTLEQFELAEASYIRQRALVAENSKVYREISEQIAVSIYKQANQLELSEPLAAANELLRIRKITPNAKIRATAEYDAVNIFMAHEKWAAAIDELEKLIKNFPNSEFVKEFHRKIAFALQKNNQPRKAARRYLWLSKNDPAPEVRREALFEAATLYENSNQIQRATEHFRQYAHRYPEPVATRMEARYHLAKNYEKMGNMDNHLYWLRRIVAGHSNAGKQQTDRSRWLASWAELKYGDYFFDEFRRYRLRPPLTETLEDKQGYFTDAVNKYEKSASYGFADLITQATYQMGKIHEQFSTDLLKFRLPNGLSAEEKSAYRQLLEQQAAPFIGLAIDIYQTNVNRAWEGLYDPWIGKTFARLRILDPMRYGKAEKIVNYGDNIR